MPRWTYRFGEIYFPALFPGKPDRAAGASRQKIIQAHEVLGLEPRSLVSSPDRISVSHRQLERSVYGDDYAVVASRCIENLQQFRRSISNCDLALILARLIY